MAWVSRFALLTISQVWAHPSVTVTVTSNRAVHVTLMWTDQPVRMHLQELLRRGLRLLGDPYFCFTQWHEIEQEEAGDTITHTFIWNTWVVGETRSFAFKGTVGGELSPSQWGIFKKTCPPIPPPTIFYSDNCPIVSAVEGVVKRIAPQQDWPGIRDGAGTRATDCFGTLTAFIRSTNPAGWNKYYECYRTIMLFDLSPFVGLSIVGAKYHVWFTDEKDTAGITPAMNLFESWPLSNTALHKSDYGRIGTTRLAFDIPFGTWPVNSWQFFQLGVSGIVYINNRLAVDGIVKLGFREARYDADDVDPFPRTANKRASFSLAGVDNVDPTHKPYLEVVWA